MLVREVRFSGDQEDNDRLVIESKENAMNRPPGIRFTFRDDTDGDGISDASETEIFGTLPLLLTLVRSWRR